MAKNFFSITFGWIKTPAKIAELEPLFDSLGNWVRFTGPTWLVITEKSAVEVYNILRTQIATEDHLLIIEANPSHYYGFAPPWFWDWLNEKARELSQ